MSEYIADARILVRPDTSRFRAELEAQLKAVTSTPITIPVVAAVAPNVSGSAAKAQAAGAAAQAAVTERVKETAAANQVAAASTAKLTAAQNASVAAATKLAFAQSEVLGAATATSAAQVTLTRSTAAVAAAQKAVGLALAANNTKLVVATEETLALAVAQETEAAAALASARANAANASSFSQLSRGAGGAGLQLFGLRGATLAASGAFLAGTAAVVGFSKAVQSAAALETELNVFRVTAGATADEMDRVSASAKQLGRDITLPGVTAGNAATAMTELAKAGLSVQDSLDGARGTLQLATAAQIDVKDSTNLVASALNSFELAGTDAVKVADLLTGAAKSSQGEITDMGTALSQAAAVSNQFGVSIEDTVTLLTQLAQAGLAGGRAGTSLRVAFLRLVNPPAEAAKALKELNVQIRDAEGDLRPEIFTDIARALQGYSKAQRDAKLATIFGSDAIRAAGIIGNKGADAFERTRDAVTEAGLAQQIAGARTQGFEGDVENLSNQMEALGVTVGNVAKGPVGALVRALGAATGAVNDTTAAADDTGVFEEFSKAVGDFAGSFTRLNISFRQGVIAGSAAKQELAALDKTVKELFADTVNMDKAFRNAARTFAATLPKDAGIAAKQIQNIIVGFDAKGVRAQIKNDNASLLASLNEEQAFLEKQLTRDYVKRRPALQRSIEQALLGTVTDIQRIQRQAAEKADGVKREAEQAARDAAQAVRDRESALLGQFGVARDQQANKVAAAAQTAGLQDDINRQKQLKALVLAQIAAVRERISLEGGRKAAVTALQAILLQVDSALDSLAEQQAAAREKRRQTIRQSISLDIDLAQITGNQSAEVSARKRLIAKLKEELALVKKGTVAYKEIRNEIAAQNKAIADMNAEKRKQGQSFAQASFEFLQAQQGFASNLIGNLIPGGATGGLVGGGSPVQAALTPAAGLADGQSKSGPTSGQAQTTNAVLLRILDQMKILNGSRAAPEAWNQYAAQQAVMDGVGGG